jgi:nodulation protein E
VLESEEHARNRGAQVYAELSGAGMTSDAGHITRPDLDGIVAAMNKALADSELSPSDIGYVNAHGTGTLLNDVTETRAIRQVFAAHADELMVSSTKSMHGHAMGASSALELISTVLALHKGVVPPTANYQELDEDCDLDVVPNTARQADLTAAMSNSFAFGGLNAVLIVNKMS